MLSKHEILNLQKRKKIYDTLLKKPGLHLRALEREVDMSLGVLRYHLNFLEKAELIKTIQDGGFTRYFVVNCVGNGDKVLVEVFRHDLLRNMMVIFLLSEDKKIFFKEDLKKLPYLRHWHKPWRYIILKHRTTLDFHINKLIKFKVLEIVKVQRKTGYKLIDSDKIWDFLIRYEDALSYKILHQLLFWTDKLVIPELVDTTFNGVWDMFPHPYHC